MRTIEKKVRWDESTIRKLTAREIRARKTARVRASLRKSAKLSMDNGRGYLCKPNDVLNFKYQEEEEEGREEKDEKEEN